MYCAEYIQACSGKVRDSKWCSALTSGWTSCHVKGCHVGSGPPPAELRSTWSFDLEQGRAGLRFDRLASRQGPHRHEAREMGEWTQDEISARLETKQTPSRALTNSHCFIDLRTSRFVYLVCGAVTSGERKRERVRRCSQSTNWRPHV